MNDSRDESQNERERSLIAHCSEPLNDFTHREGKSPSISSPEDLVTEVTPAQRERIIYLVDDAIETLRMNLDSPKSDVRQKAADSILDRAGMSKNARSAEESALNISAEAIVKVVKGLAEAFGSGAPDAPAPPLRTVSAEQSEQSEQKRQNAHLPSSLLQQYQKENL